MPKKSEPVKEPAALKSGTASEPEEQETEETVPGGDGAASLTTGSAVEAAEESGASPGFCEPCVAPAVPEWDFAVPPAVDPQPLPDDVELSDPALYFNRELSWLDFNARVLAQALDARTPMLEQVRFLAITANNLDEFFRKRVGGLKRQEAAGVVSLSPDGRTPAEQLDLVRRAIIPMYRTIIRVWEDGLRPKLDAAGIAVRDYADLSDDQQSALDTYFHTHIFPILTPLAVDPGHPFPFISNLSLSLAVMLRHPARGTEHFARLKVPISRGRWISIPGEVSHFVPVEQIIRANVAELFRGMEVVAVSAFRITRNADMRRSEEEADDLLSMISEEIRERRFADVVRLEVEEDMPAAVLRLLERELELEPEDVYVSDGLLELADLTDLADLPFPQYQYPRWEPIVPIRLRHEGESEDKANLFAVIRRRDLLVHHPYESFTASTLRFVEEAALDPHVLAIKLTLYRTSKDSPVVAALRRAAEAGKQVAALIELKARFDEERNIEMAQALEKAGVHVTYGLVGLKTHAKTTLVVREEADGLRTYSHISTGNYNPTTAWFYTDLGLLTANRAIGSDLVNLFHYLTGYAPEQRYQKLHVAPRDLRPAFLALIDREIEHQEATGNGRIICKMNALDDPVMIRKLYDASRAGVKISLIVRGHCRLRPGVPGLSETIEVLSIVGRFLEHSRIYYFGNGGEPKAFIGSADWQRRNLEDRVEVVVPIDDPKVRERLKRTLKFCLKDNRLAWDLDADGLYTQRRPAPDEPERAFHDVLMGRALRRSVEEDLPWDI